MNQKEFIENIENFYKKGVDIIRKKNTDYAVDHDPFKNFRFAEMVGVSVKRGILVRMSDKLARLSNLIDREAVVKDETIEDSLIDLCNYGLILLVYLKDENAKRNL